MKLIYRLKLIGCLVVFSTSTLQSTAQIRESFFLIFDYGLSVPIGDFGRKEGAFHEIGMANIGSVLNFHTGIKITKYIGVTFAGMNSRWTVNTDELAAELSKNALNRVYPTSEDWENTSYLFGLYSSMALNDNNSVSLGFRLLGGPSTTFLPAISAQDNNIYFDRLSQEASSTAWLLGTKLSVDIFSNIAIYLSTDLFYTKPEFKEVHVARNTTGISISDMNVPITSVNFGFGISFLF